MVKISLVVYVDIRFSHVSSVRTLDSKFKFTLEQFQMSRPQYVKGRAKQLIIIIRSESVVFQKQVVSMIIRRSGRRRHGRRVKIVIYAKGCYRIIVMNFFYNKNTLNSDLNSIQY